MKTEDFSKYYVGSNSLFRVTERCFNHLAPYVPDYISGVLEIGCANGRNLLPFQNFDLYGIDLVPKEKIVWFKRLKINYEQISIQDFTARLEKFDVDLSKILIISSGVLMFISKEEQEKFFKTVLNCGCKNFIFQEYPDSTKHFNQYFKLDKLLFMQKEYRRYLGQHEPVTYILLDIPDEAKKNLSTAPTRLSLSELKYLWVSKAKNTRRLLWQLAGMMVRFKTKLMKDVQVTKKVKKR